MPDDPNVLVPLAEFTKLLRRITDLERKLSALEARNPDNSSFEKAVLTSADSAAQRFAESDEFHLIIKKHIEEINFEDIIDEVLTEYDFREIIRSLDLTIHVRRLIGDADVIRMIALAVIADVQRSLARVIPLSGTAVPPFEERYCASESQEEDE
jgi:hypothetical protein